MKFIASLFKSGDFPHKMLRKRNIIKTTNDTLDKLKTIGKTINAYLHGDSPHLKDMYKLEETVKRAEDNLNALLVDFEHQNDDMFKRLQDFLRHFIDQRWDDQNISVRLEGNKIIIADLYREFEFLID